MKTTLGTRLEAPEEGKSRLSLRRCVLRGNGVLRRISFCSEEPYYDDDDPQEEYYSPEPQDGAEPGANGAADEDADNIVPSGDPAAAAKDNLKSHKDKKIPNDQRTTTPYMTKYEKARILGTRALQIR